MRETLAVIGAGTIGRSFARLFARSGYAVRVWDPRDDLAEVVAAIRADVADDLAGRSGTSGANVGEPTAQGAPTGEPTAPGAQAAEPTDPETAEPGSVEDGRESGSAEGGGAPLTAGTVEIAESLEDAVASAILVQESGPEDPTEKPRLFARIAAAAPAGAVLATSSSTIPASHLAADLPAEAAARVIVGHPFNPPHIMPLVEVVPSPVTSAEAIAAALEVYRACGREPVVLRREVRGFVGNRLQNALMKEAIALVENGVVTAAELDAVMRNSLGLRWSAVGQFEGMHLGGGEAGIRGFMDHIGPAFAAIEDLPLDLGEEALESVFRQVEDAYGVAPSAEAAAERDRIQAAVLKARGQAE